jgi:hypothetical protein
MINFGELDVVAANDDGEKYSFVGIKDKQLRLPKGCEDWARRIGALGDTHERFLSARDAFVLLFRVLKRYREAHNKALANDRDSAQVQAGAGRELLAGTEEQGLIYYRHFDFLDCILDAFDEQGILSLAQRVGNTGRIDYGRMHRYLHHATFLDDDTAVIDQMSLPRVQVAVAPVEIVQLFCFVLAEVKTLLGERGTLSPEIRALGEQFFESHLDSGDSLFAPEAWTHVKSILAERLELIDHHTTVKDEDYYVLHTALTHFLNGNSVPSDGGPQWGISSFAPVWEDICVRHALSQKEASIAACDTTSLGSNTARLPDSLTDLQTLVLPDGKELRLNTTPRFAGVFEINGSKLFPDCVLLERDLDRFKEEMYVRYNTQSLCDSISTASALIDPVFVNIWKKIKIRDGPDQRAASAELDALIKGGAVTNPLTAFYLGRAMAGAYEPFPDTRARNFNEVIKGGKSDPLHFNLMLGVIWETYFDKFDAFRDKDTLSRRLSLGGHTSVKTWISQNPDSEVSRVYDDLEHALALVNKKKARKCRVIDFKYFGSSYFDGDAESLRSRSLRKQFVYEYLIDVAMGDDHSVSSAFWIPGWSANGADAIAQQTNSLYMGKSVPLFHMNMGYLLETYVTG